MTDYRALLEYAARVLAAAGVENAAAEAEEILADLAGISRSLLALRRRDAVPPELAEHLEAVLVRRRRREPWQYIAGRAWFRHLELEVTPAVLIPRPETEILVDLALRLLPSGGRAADIGTGSGAIALSLAYERPDLAVAAADISGEALAVAARNRARYGLERVELLRGDLARPLAGRTFDLVAANLPYISETEYRILEPEVRDHEPQLALTAPEEGLALIRHLAQQAPAILAPEGVLLLEIGMSQGEAVRAILAGNGFQGIRLEPDLTGRTRFVLGYAPAGGV